MGERNPISAPVGAGEVLDYKPLSLFAVGGLLVAAVYAALVVVTAGAALAKGEPFFMGDWTIALAIAGAVLSGLGLWQIYSSEGTRAGAALARWGLAISLVTGLGYFIYQTFTGLAIVQQANSFLVDKDSGFFSRLQGNAVDVNSAFLLVVDVADRGVRPDNAAEMARFDAPAGQNPKGMLTVFLECPVVKVVRQAAGSVKLEPLAVRSWAYENGGYHIVRTYRISTDEAVYEVKMTVSSIEAVAEGEKRRWKVEMQDMVAPLQPMSRTALGEKRQGQRQQALDFLGDAKTGWLQKVRSRRDLEVYLATKPPANRETLRERAEAAGSGTLLVALAGGSIGPLSARAGGEWMSRLLPDYRPPSRLGDYFKIDRVRVWDPAYLPRVLAAAKQMLAPEMLPLLNLRVLPDEMAPCQVQSGELLVTIQAQAVINMEGQKDGVLLLFKMVVAAPENVDPGAAGADQQWYLRSAELVRALSIPPRQM